MPIIKQICKGLGLGMKGRDSWVSSPYHSSQKYHEQGQDQDDGAAQVGMVVLFQLILRTVDELKGHLFLGRSPDMPQTQGFSYGPPGTLEASNPCFTSSSSHSYRSQLWTSRARFRFQISRKTVAAVSTEKCHRIPGVAEELRLAAVLESSRDAATHPTEP